MAFTPDPNVVSSVRLSVLPLPPPLTFHTQDNQTHSNVCLPIWLVPQRSLITDDRMLVDGLVYFVAMTAVNAVNMIIFLNSSDPVRKGS